MSNYDKHILSHPKSDPQIREVAELDQSYFGEMGYHFFDLRAMLNNYPKGTFCLNEKANGRLVFTIGVWPIRSELFYKMRDEYYPESLVKPEDILTNSSGQYWWIAGLLENPKNKETDPMLIASFLQDTFQTWSRSFSPEKPISLIATGFSRSGLLLLKSFKFTPALDGKSNVHSLETNVVNFNNLLSSKIAKYKDRVVD